MKRLTVFWISLLAVFSAGQAISQPSVCMGTDMPGGVFKTAKASIIDENGALVKDITAEVAMACDGKAACAFVMKGGLSIRHKAVAEGTCNDPPAPASFSTEFGAKTLEFACPCIPVEP